MELKGQHARVLSDSDKVSVQSLVTSALTTRKKLIESGLHKDSLTPIQAKSRLNLRSSSKLSSKPFQNSYIHPSQRGLILRDIRPVREISTGKSPSSIKRNSSVEGVKFESRRKKDKPTDRISYLAEQFSVKKVNELVKLAINGDFCLCRAFIALIAEVDYHIKESQNFPIEVFFDYLNSPGIVVQTIKKIPDFLINDKIPATSYTKSLELFNQIHDISSNPSLELLAELMQSIYMLKDLSYKPLATQDSSRNSTRQNHTPQHSVDFSKISVVSSEFIRPTAKTQFKVGFENKTLQNSFKIQINEEFVPGVNPMQTKSILLDKFFSKMGLSQAELTQRKTSREYRGRSQDFFDDFQDSKFIKPVKENRASSLTPTSNDLKKAELKVNLETKGRIDRKVSSGVLANVVNKRIVGKAASGNKSRK